MSQFKMSQVVDDDFFKKMVTITLWKLLKEHNGGKLLEVTMEDLEDFQQQCYRDPAKMPTMFYHMHRNSFEIGVLPLDDAKSRAQAHNHTH